MDDRKTFDALWNELKEESNEVKELFEISESISNIINSIVYKRVEKGLSQRDLAELCGVKQSAIARMERLQAIPRLDTVVKVARCLDLKLKTESIPKCVSVPDPIYVDFPSYTTGNIHSYSNYNTQTPCNRVAFGG